MATSVSERCRAVSASTFCSATAVSPCTTVVLATSSSRWFSVSCVYTATSLSESDCTFPTSSAVVSVTSVRLRSMVSTRLALFCLMTVSSFSLLALASSSATVVFARTSFTTKRSFSSSSWIFFSCVDARKFSSENGSPTRPSWNSTTVAMRGTMLSASSFCMSTSIRRRSAKNSVDVCRAATSRSRARAMVTKYSSASSPYSR
mmetsp:Transcript_57791/g.139574  ORF Transcript_57791/g.139574 Transcript_57791/m.139574 type:complete len:204 (-) Transcript_57791:450-1061(-)